MANASIFDFQSRGIAQMNQADLILAQRQAIRTLATLRARQAIKRQFQELGIKYREVKARDLMLASQRYLEEHSVELCAEAQGTVDQWIANGVLGKRLQRAWAEQQSRSDNN